MHPYYLLSRLSFSWVQSRPTLCDPMDCSTPGLPVHYSNSCPLNRWCHPSISSSVIPFSSCLQSFPASGSFPMSQFFTSGGQIIGVSASASILPMNIQDWFPLGWTGWISLQSEGLSRVFSNTTVLQVIILEWVAFPFSRGTSHPRDRTQVSLTAGRFFTSWATREAHTYLYAHIIYTSV